MNNKFTCEQQTAQDQNSHSCHLGKNLVEVEVYSNFDILEKRQQEWDSFVESVGSEIFLTYDWCRIWWKYYGKGRALRVFIFRSNDELVGILPFFFEKIRLGPISVKAVKIVGSDFTLAQFSLPIKYEYIAVIMKSCFELLDREKWDIAHIGPIAGLYQHYDDLKKACEDSLRFSHLVLAEKKGVQTYFKLAETWDDQLANLKAKERSKIKRHYRLARKVAGNNTADIEAHCADTENLEEVFTDFVQMHQAHWQELGKLGHFKDWPAAYQFHHELAQAQLKQNRLCLIRISLDNRYLGYKYGYILGRNYIDFLDARLDCKEFASVGLGRIIYSEMIKMAIENGARSIDSMRGLYKHKLEMGGEIFPIRKLYIVPRKPTTIIRVSLFRLAARLLDFLYYRIWFSKISPKMTMKKKHLWKSWIRSAAFR